MEALILLGLLATGSAAGVLGALFGLGGGIIFVPVLMLAFGLAPTEAVAVSLIGIIAGSVGASTVFVDKGLSNVRLGLMMEITTATGAIIGAIVATYLEEWVLMCVFSAIVIYSALRMILNPEKVVPPSDGADGRFTFEYRDEAIGDEVRYEVQNIKGGMALCTVAGMISSMTGVGGGAVKVPLMNIYMHVPMKAASPTSSYMIGITAFSGAITYFLSGQVLLEYAAGIAIGAFAGSILGTALARRMQTKRLRRYFSILLIAVAVLVLLQAGGIL
ncbi:MAG: sulfite exporter TauE/SafE family protein [Candidatus Methanomethylophilaceae archaeon]|nr:sulfite exporter TauE/SafE family protein [Candidatus Methanomethylophilaceae archaeon]